MKDEILEGVLDEFKKLAEIPRPSKHEEKISGTHESLLQAASFVQTIQTRQGLKVSCVEEIAYRMKYIDADQLLKLAEPLSKNDYGQYLQRLANQKL